MKIIKKLLLLLSLTSPIIASESHDYTSAVIAGAAISAIPVATYFFYKKYNLPIPEIQTEETPGADISAEHIMNQFDIMEVRTEIEIRTGYPNGLSDRELASLVAEEEKYRTHKAQYWKLLQLQRQQASRLKENRS
jgi:hypothetical protein